MSNVYTYTSLIVKEHFQGRLSHGEYVLVCSKA